MARQSKTRSPIARRLKEARARAGVSQRQLGALVGLDLSVASVRMNQYERGVHEPHYSFVKRLSAALNVPTAYFYAEDPALAVLITGYGRLSATARKDLVKTVTQRLGGRHEVKPAD